MSDYKMPPKKRGRGNNKQEPIPIVPELLAAFEKLKKEKEIPGKLEFRLHPKSNRINRRVFSSKGYWFDWGDSCIHGNAACVTCDPKPDRKKKKVEIPTTSIGKKKTRRKIQTNEFTAKRKRRIKSPNEVQQENIKKEQSKLDNRKKKIEEYIENGYNDRREIDLPCPDCHKKRISSYEYNYILNTEIETYCRLNVSHQEKRIRWEGACIECKQERPKRDTFNVDVISRIITHINGDREDAKKIFEEIDSDTCYTCGVDIIKHSISGWKQCSINDKNPGRALNEETPIEDFVVCCLACNRFQNKLSFKETLESLIMICDVDSTYDRHNLTKQDIIWLKQKSCGSMDGELTCPFEVRMHVIEKYGTNCFYTGVPLLFESNDPFTISFDRQDGKEYVTKNVRPVSKHINYVKVQNIKESDLIEWIMHIRKNRDRFVKMLNKLW